MRINDERNAMGASGGGVVPGKTEAEMIIEVERLVKKYGDVVAVNDISFSIQKGSCFGLLGPNGAGKTTTIEMMEGIISPTSGEIRFKDRKRGPSFREEIGIQFQQTELLGFLKVEETLATFAKFYKKSVDLETLIERCQLTEVRKQYSDKMSGGQKQRLYLALALINDPSLLFLDEPSTGLDPQARKHLWDIVGKVKADGKSIILTTHYMEEAEYLCDEIAIMDHGRIIAQGSPSDLIREHCGGSTLVIPETNFKIPLESLPFERKRKEGFVEIETEEINDVVKALLALGVDLSDLRVRTPNLENVFLNLTGRSLRD